MSNRENSDRIARLIDEIRRLEATVAQLQQDGHVHDDAERHLKRLKKDLAHVKAK